MITVEVTGTNTRNKGAELMLMAVLDHFGSRSDIELAVDQFFGSYAERAQYGLLQRIALTGWGRSRIAVHLMPPEFRRSFGLVREDDVDVLLDASGFAFGDQHPAARTREFAERVESAKERGQIVILLPQAFGPFSNSDIRSAFVRVVEAADLLYARDEVSLEHVCNAAGERDHVRLAPDFTGLLQPDRSNDPSDSDRACIVPNMRMIDKAQTPEQAEAYPAFMATCVDVVSKVGLNPVLLVHEEDDGDLAARIRRSAEENAPIYGDSDPLALKRFLGESHLVVGSRFHALVGALSQGVPAIGTSWSHKYRMLFQAYGCPDFLVSVPTDRERVRQCVEKALGRGRDELIHRIGSAGRELDQQSRTMWNQVDELIAQRRAREERMKP